jgi:4-alpha-glucanotransferase
MEAFMKKRGSGILCHITSLPSQFGIGDLGPAAFAFADFLAEAKQGYWQVLPMNPTVSRYMNSPFSTVSSCAGNTIMISPEALRDEGLLTQAELDDHPPFPEEMVDYQQVARFKQHLLKRAHQRFREHGEQSDEFRNFCNEQGTWLEEHSLFIAIFEHLGESQLADWPAGIKGRNPEQLQKMRETLADSVEREKFLQFSFHKQWHALRMHCNGKGVQIIGDFPLFVSYDSVDVWVHPELFRVDENLKPVAVPGAPPDDFSPEGQIFNCAVYNWEPLKESGFDWWVKRFRSLFSLYDVVRIDHFRGLISYWELPLGSQNGMNGNWIPVPTSEFLNTMVRFYPSFPVIAEDLGTITAEVREAMYLYGIPPMKVLVLGFENRGFESVYLPHNHVENCVVYTGTHDTATAVEWFEQQGHDADREVLFQYLGRRVESGINWEFIRMAMMSVASTCIIQMQDLLGLGGDSRMNRPGKAEGNWLWRFKEEGYREHAPRLAEMSARYGRAR